MRALQFLTFVVLLLSCGEAQAFNYFSIGPTTGLSPGDPGIASYEFMAVTFDRPSAWFVTEQDNVPHSRLIFQGTTVNVAATPAGDTSKYEAISPYQSAVFSFGPVAPLIGTISLYLGSIDAYNSITLLGPNGQPLGVIRGSQWPQDDGDQFAAASNRRIYITNLPSNFWGLMFQSSGIAEEYDDIAVSSATFCVSPAPGCITDGGTYLTLPTPLGLSNPIPAATAPLSVPGSASFGLAAPEPGAWLLMTTAFGLLGSALRVRRTRRGGVAQISP